MEQKSFVLQNGGMNRDLSVSKAGKSSVFENRNIRVESRENDTLLSMTNERGTEEVDSVSILGTLVGWNVLNQFLILFTADGDTSRIYRVKYNDSDFTYTLLFEDTTGALGFSPEYPIESIVDYETESVQKIYWVDGEHVLRFLTFSDEYLTSHLESGELDNPDNPPIFSFSDDVTWFDSTRPAENIPIAKITKDNSSGNPRPSGTVQYFLSYYNKYGQQTGIIYSSPIVYLSPSDRGGAADELNNNLIKLEFSGLDSSFENVRLYQILRTSLDGTVVAYLVAETGINDGNATFIDDGTNLGTVDAASFLYLGSQDVHASTMSQKDNTLFLGGLTSIGNKCVDQLKKAIERTAFYLNGESFKYNRDWESAIVEFKLTTDNDVSSAQGNVPHIQATGYYPYRSQLGYNKSQISTFKGGEKYRFALKFYRPDGTSSKAFWIGDKVNKFYPRINNTHSISRAIAKCTIPDDVISAATDAGFASVQLLIAQATNSDRSVLAQGIISPTVFNLYERYLGHAFSQNSWIYRPKYGSHPFAHFSGLSSPYTEAAELQNAWGGDENFVPSPLYKLNASGRLMPLPYGAKNYTHINITATGSEYNGTLSISYYESVDDANPHTETYHLAGLPFAVKTWLKAYDKSDVPYNYRLSEVEILKELAKTNIDYALSDGDPLALDYKSTNPSRKYSFYNRQHYFIDESIISLNSPEIEYGNVDVDRNSGLNLRIVGAAGVTGNITDYTASAKNTEMPGEQLLSVDFSKKNISDDADGLSAWPLYTENYAPDAAGNHMLYMWHKHGSIPGRNDSDNIAISELGSKVFANLRFAAYTVYNNYLENVWSVKPDDIRQINDLSRRLYDLYYKGNKVLYSSGAEQLVQMPGDTTYPVLYSKSVSSAADAYDLSTTTDSADPVQISYTSRQHAVISLGSNILPYLFGKDAAKTYTGSYVPWEDASLAGKNLIYRIVDFNNATDVADISKGAFTYFEMVSQVSSEIKTIRAYLSQNDALRRDLDDFFSCREKLKSGNLYAHVTFNNNSVYNTLLVDLYSLQPVKTTVTMSLGDQSSSYKTEFVLVKIESTVPMTSIRLDIYGRGPTNSSNSTLLYTKTITSETGTVSHYFQTPSFEKNLGYQSFEACYKVSYKVPEYDNDKLIPDLDKLAEGTGLILDKPETIKSIVEYDYVYAENAECKQISSLTSDESFVDVALDSNAVLKYNGSSFVFDGMLTSKYTNPSHTEYSLPLNSQVKEDSQVLLIGELYKDYDSIAKSDPSMDTRYGGISKSAVDSNTFIAAGPRRMLDDLGEEPEYSKTEIDLSDLIEHIQARQSSESYSLTATIKYKNVSGENEKAPQVINITCFDDTSVDDFLPTSENKVRTLAVERNGESWYSTIEGISSYLKDAISNKDDYKVVLLRNGYARRGKWRKRKGKNGQTETTHTTRQWWFRQMRRGPLNSLPAKRLRIIGMDLLISNSVEAMKEHSQTFRQDRRYFNSTLVSSLADEIVLPAMPSYEKTPGGRYANNAKDGLAELFIGLYHKEGASWKLVSNIVQVRGRNYDKTKLWEFDSENYIAADDEQGE